MLKSIIAATLLSTALLGLTAITASANQSAADCAYAKMNLANGVGATSSMNYNANAVLLQGCK